MRTRSPLSSFPLFLVLFFLVSGCQNASNSEAPTSSEETPKHFIISGKINSPLSEKLRLSFEAFKKYRGFETRLDSSGQFSLEIPIERPSYFQLKQGKLRTMIFAEPGDSIWLSADGKTPFETLSFKGDGEARNQYLLKRQRFSIDTFQQAKKSLFKEEVLRKGGDGFNRKLDSVYRMEENFLTKHADSLNARFQSYEKRRLAFDRATKRFRFKNYLRYKGPDSIELGQAFWEPIEELDLTASENLGIPSYFSFLRFYGRQLHQKRVESDSSLADSARFPVLYRAFKDKVTNDTARDAFLAKNLYHQLLLRGSERTEPYLKELEEAPFFASVQDSLQNLYQKWQTIAKGQEAPGFAYPNLEGDTLSLSDLKGNYVYIDAWATWCGPCKREIPHLKELEERFSDTNLHFVSISLDRENRKDRWKKMVEEKELGGHQLIANGEAFGSEFAQAYLIRSIPRFILIGPDGKVIDNDAKRPSNGAQEQLEKVLEQEG